MTMDKINTTSKKKLINEKGNTKPETAYDIFGKSVALQLKALSLENALLAQCRIQSVLTEFGITDYRQRSTYNYTISDYSNNQSPSAFSEETDISYNNDDTKQDLMISSIPEPDNQTDESSQLPPTEIVYALDDGSSHITEIIYTNNNAPVDFDNCYEGNDDAITAAMSATYDAMQKANEH